MWSSDATAVAAKNGNTKHRLKTTIIIIKTKSLVNKRIGDDDDYLLKYWNCSLMDSVGWFDVWEQRRRCKCNQATRVLWSRFWFVKHILNLSPSINQFGQVLNARIRTWAGERLSGFCLTLAVLCVEWEGATWRATAKRWPTMVRLLVCSFHFISIDEIDVALGAIPKLIHGISGRCACSIRVENDSPKMDKKNDEYKRYSQWFRASLFSTFRFVFCAGHQAPINFTWSHSHWFSDD